MAKFEYSRQQRVAEDLRRGLAEIIRDSIADPRVGMVSITRISISRDFAHARVFVSVLELAGGDPKDSLAALNKAAGFLRHELGLRLQSRGIPKLRFIEDPTEREAAELDLKIRQARAQDKDAITKRGEEDDS